MAEQRSFFQLLADPEEGPFLQALLRDARDFKARRAYADWLIARGEARGELLRLGELLGAPEPPANGAALRARFAELSQSVEPFWRALATDRSWVLNCGEAAALEAPVRFAYECDLSWEAFEPTSTPGVRHCGRCDREVYACSTSAEAARHARAGRCISVSAELAQSKRDTLARSVTGRPHIPSYWARELFGVHVENPRPGRF